MDRRYALAVLLTAIVAAAALFALYLVQSQMGLKGRAHGADWAAHLAMIDSQDEFEKLAARALAAGEPEHEAVSGGTYRFAGPITLRAECLKCHLPSRSSNKSRTAGLLISIPVGAD